MGIEEYQKSYDNLVLDKRDIEDSIKKLKKKAAKAKITFNNGTFIKDDYVYCATFQYAFVSRYVGELGTMYSGYIGAEIIEDALIPDLKKVIEFIYDNQDDDELENKLEALKLPYWQDINRILSHEYGDFFPTVFDVDESEWGDKEDFSLKLIAKGGEHGSEGQWHDDSVVKLCYIKRSEYNAIKSKHIENAVDDPW